MIGYVLSAALTKANLKKQIKKGKSMDRKTSLIRLRLFGVCPKCHSRTTGTSFGRKLFAGISSVKQGDSGSKDYRNDRILGFFGQTLFKLMFIVLIIILINSPCSAQNKNSQENMDRMDWWREARFGMFVHWGLYAIPAGEWGREKGHAEWIRHTAQIPIDEYDKFVDLFNPIKFDADQWAQMAKDAGMKYIVITSKHHDGFCLFDSEFTDYDVMSTPFKRDIMKELSDACQKHDLKMCWYHSIMDWHHPDYLPRRDWEDRAAEGADLNRYIKQMKSQVKELLTNYGSIGVMWFDGEWEGTWKHEHGLDLYKFCREIQPDVIVNNRVDKGRSGMAGMTVDESFAGDFGTPEQEIPATGLPDVDWETCMTMNRHWGYNKYDKDFKSTKDLIHKLADIASKGGNFLLNIGPTAEGLFPQESIDRLREIGEWMKIYKESIYETQASPFKELDWGRCTQQKLDSGQTRLFLHVFEWPEKRKLIVPGIYNKPVKAFLLSDNEENPLKVKRKEDALIIKVPIAAPDPINSVVVMDIVGKPDVSEPPEILAENNIFMDQIEVRITSERENIKMRYTLDGETPTKKSALAATPIYLDKSTVVTTRAFRDGKPVSGSRQIEFKKVAGIPAMDVENVSTGIRYEYYEGDWDFVPEFKTLKPIKIGITPAFDFSPQDNEEYFSFKYTGYIKIPEDGVYTFFTKSDDGSQLFIDNKMVVDNDGLHGAYEQQGALPLRAGFHGIVVTFFEKTGSDMLEVYWKGSGIKKEQISDNVLFFSE
jgi:alpha-L-fucosidase